MVYIDDANISYGRMIMCHMVADSLEELHEMAERLSLRKYFQDKPRKPHYDICLKKKNLALRLGAVEVRSRELIEILKTLSFNSAKPGDSGAEC